jgi:flagellar assembly protein FliH
MFRDGPKSTGRYIKRKTKLAECVKAVSYSFEEITAQHVESMDNTYQTILHAKLHDEENLNKFVKPAGINENQLLEQDPVLWPRNFTSDWQKERDRLKRRGTKISEDDDLDLEQEFNQANRDPNPKSSSSKKEEDTQRADGEKEIAHESMNQFKKHLETIDVVGKAIKDLQSPHDTDATGLKVSVSQPQQNTNDTDSFQPETPPIVESQPVNTSENHPIPAPVVPQVSEEELDAIREQAKQEGYSSGFKIGEEKGLIKTQESLNKLFSNLGSLLSELSSLKQNILLNVQETFYDISQGLGEALIGREFNVSKTAFADVLRTAIRDTVPGDKFKIQLNPKTFAMLEKTSISEFINVIEHNDAIPENEFRIVSQLTTVDGNLKQIISELIHRIDISQVIDSTSEKQDKKASEQDEKNHNKAS